MDFSTMAETYRAQQRARRWYLLRESLAFLGVLACGAFLALPIIAFFFG